MWLAGGVVASTAVGIVALLAITAVRRPERPPLVDRTRRLVDPAPERPSWDEPASTSPSSTTSPSSAVLVEVMPRVIKRYSPTYPDSARRAGIEGLVEVRALVGTDGRVKETRLASSDPVFDRSAEHAVRQYTFEPARSGGRPVAVWVLVPIRYTLAEEDPPTNRPFHAPARRSRRARAREVASRTWGGLRRGLRERTQRSPPRGSTAARRRRPW